MALLGAASLFCLFCASNIIWMQSNTLQDGVITSPELFIQRDTSTVVISSHEITYSLEELIEDFDFGLYIDIPKSFWENSYLNRLQYRFISDSSIETELLVYIENNAQSLNGYGYDSIEQIHWQSQHNEPPEATYTSKPGTVLTPDLRDSIQVVASSIGRTENTLEYLPEYEDYQLIIHSLDGSNIETRLSLGVRMPVFSLLRNIFVVVGAASGITLLSLYSGGRGDE